MRVIEEPDDGRTVAADDQRAGSVRAHLEARRFRGEPWLDLCAFLDVPKLNSTTQIRSEHGRLQHDPARWNEPGVAGLTIESSVDAFRAAGLIEAPAAHLVGPVSQRERAIGRQLDLAHPRRGTAHRRSVEQGARANEIALVLL